MLNVMLAQTVRVRVLSVRTVYRARTKCTLQFCAFVWYGRGGRRRTLEV
jgi:hypothetical protein